MTIQISTATEMYIQVLMHVLNCTFFYLHVQCTWLKTLALSKCRRKLQQYFPVEMSITWSFYPPWDIFNIFGKAVFCLIIYWKTYCDQASVQGCCLRKNFGSPLSSLNRKLGARATFFSSPLGFKFPEKCLFASFSQRKLFAYSRWTHVLCFHFKSAKWAGNSVIPSLEVGIEGYCHQNHKF